MEVWVIVCSQGEYSGRYEWVAGVYTDRDEAVRIAEERLRAAKAAEVLHSAWSRASAAVQRQFPFTLMFSAHPQYQAWRELNPPPPASEFDDVTVYGPISLNTWGRFDSFDVTEKSS